MKPQNDDEGCCDREAENSEHYEVHCQNDIETILCRVERRSQSYSVAEKSIIGIADEREVKTF